MMVVSKLYLSEGDFKEMKVCAIHACSFPYSHPLYEACLHTLNY
jgi:hypothetical protein